MTKSAYEIVAEINGWGAAAETSEQSLTADEHDSFQKLASVLEDYETGHNKERSRLTIARMNAAIKLHDNLTGTMADLFESVADTEANQLDNVTRMRTTLWNTNTALERSRNPRSEFIASSTLKALTQPYDKRAPGRVTALYALTEAYTSEQAGALDRIPAMQLHSILNTIAKKQEGLFVFDPETQEVSLDAQLRRQIGTSTPGLLMQIENVLENANAGYAGYQHAKTNLAQGWSDAEALAAQIDATTDTDDRMRLANELHLQIEALVAGEKEGMGLIDKVTAETTLKNVHDKSEEYKLQYENYKYLSEKMRGGVSKSDQRVKALANPYFRQWAQQNGFSIGFSNVEENTYTAGRDDNRAFLAYGRQLKRPNMYGILSSPGMLTGEFVSYKLKPSEETLAQYQQKNGKYAYRVDTGEALTSKQVQRLNAQRDPRYLQITSAEGVTALYDKKAKKVYGWRATDEESGLYGWVELPRGDLVSAGVFLEDPPGTLDEKYAETAIPAIVTTETGKRRFMDSVDVLKPLESETDPTAESSQKEADEMIDGIPIIEERDDVPGAITKRGKMVKQHASKLANPENHGGYVEILNENGVIEKVKFDQIVDGQVVIEHTRSDVNVFNVRNAIVGRAAYRRGVPPEVDIEDEDLEGDRYSVGGINYVGHAQAVPGRQRKGVWDAILGWVSKDSMRGAEAEAVAAGEDAVDYEARDAARVAAEEAEAAEEAAAAQAGAEAQAGDVQILGDDFKADLEDDPFDYRRTAVVQDDGTIEWNYEHSKKGADEWVSTTGGLDKLKTWFSNQYEAPPEKRDREEQITTEFEKQAAAQEAREAREAKELEEFEFGEDTGLAAEEAARKAKGEETLERAFASVDAKSAKAKEERAEAERVAAENRAKFGDAGEWAGEAPTEDAVEQAKTTAEMAEERATSAEDVHWETVPTSDQEEATDAVQEPAEQSGGMSQTTVPGRGQRGKQLIQQMRDIAKRREERGEEVSGPMARLQQLEQLRKERKSGRSAAKAARSKEEQKERPVRAARKTRRAVKQMHRAYAEDFPIPGEEGKTARDIIKEGRPQQQMVNRSARVQREMIVAAKERRKERKEEEKRKRKEERDQAIAQRQ